MRDLRRYLSPVVIQNAGQVNVAADGGQQVNVKERSRKKTAKAGRSKKAGNPKQLSAPKQTINMEPASASVPTR